MNQQNQQIQIIAVNHLKKMDFKNFLSMFQQLILPHSEEHLTTNSMSMQIIVLRFPMSTDVLNYKDLHSKIQMNSCTHFSTILQNCSQQVTWEGTSQEEHGQEKLNQNSLTNKDNYVQQF